MHRSIRPLGHLFVSALLWFWVVGAQAVPIVIPIELLREAAPDATPDPNAEPQQRLAQLVRAHFDHWGLSIDNGVLFGSVPIEAYREELVSFCAVPLPMEIQTDPATAQIALDPQGQFVVDVDDLRTITISANLPGHLRVNTPARVIWGQAVPFVGNCEKLNTDHGSLSLDLPFELNFTIALHTALDYDAANVAIVLDKHAVISGDIGYGAGSIDSDFGGVSLTDAVISAFERYLLRALTNGGQNKFAEQVQGLNRRLDGLNADGQRDPAIAPFNGRTAFPLLQDLEDAKTAGALIAQLGLGETLVDTLNRRGGELLMQWASVGVAERTALLDAIAAEAGCELLTQKFSAPLSRTPLYTLRGSACVAADGTASEASFFADAACSQAVAFRPTSDLQFCSARLSRTAKASLGNGAAWEPVTDQPNDPLPQVASLPWTAELSTRLNIGVLSSQTLKQPYVKKLVYKTAVTAPGRGTCSLEMRVYKSAIAATGLTPLIALHGGTWRNRGWSFLGLEATVAQFTERGFIVFTPFYRLAGNNDGNAECSDASWQEITADIEDALDWTQANGPALGAAAGPVRVFGQSAGAHLAAWLASYRSDAVAQALLFYPPLDFLEFLQGVVAGGRYERFSDFGLDALAKLFGTRNDAEIDLRALAPALNNVSATPQDLAAVIPDAAFRLTETDFASPPLYLTRCAAATGLDLAGLDPASPAPALLACLKQDLGKFLADNALIARLKTSGVPIHIVHGGADELVPFDQAIQLCNASDGGNRPIEITGDALMADCGTENRIHVVANANHALDLGLCAGDLCPAGQPGTPTRRAVENAVQDGYDWLERTVSITDPPGAPPAPDAPLPSETPPNNNTAPATDTDTDRQAERQQSSGSGTWSVPSVLALLLWVVARRQCARAAKISS